MPALVLCALPTVIRLCTISPNYWVSCSLSLTPAHMVFPRLDLIAVVREGARGSSPLQQ